MAFHVAGELGSADIEPVPQAQFTPLPEALCLVVSRLNRDSQPATLGAVRDGLWGVYRGIKQPSEEIVYETLESLLKEHKLYHTGDCSKI